MTAPRNAAASAAEDNPLRMIPVLLVPRLARPGANRYALELLGRLACVDTGLREAAREQLASRRAAQAADKARAVELEDAFVAALVRKHRASELGFDNDHERLHAPLLAAFVHAEGARQLRDIVPQKMSCTPYADALRQLQPQCQGLEDSLEERVYAGLGSLGLTTNARTGEEKPGRDEQDPVMLDHAHTMREFVVDLWEALVGVMHNGWYDEDDERQFNVPGHQGSVWSDPPVWFERD